MISLIVFFLMLVLYKRHRAWSLFLFFICLGNGCSIFPYGEGTFKIDDMSLAFILLICGYHVAIRDWSFFSLDRLAKRVWWMLAFIMAVTLFSIIYYEVPYVYVIRMARFHLFVLAYFIIRDQSYTDLVKTFRMLGTLTFVTAILFIFQLPLNQSLLLNTKDVVASADYGGFSRFTNMPPYANMFLFLSVFTGKTFVLWRFKQKLLVPGTYVLMRLATMGRTSILITMASLLLGICWKRKEYFKWVVLGFILLTPVLVIVQTSFQNRGTGGDIEGIFRGEYKNYATGYKGQGEETTLLYRVAWFYERATYLSERPLPEQLMGLPYIPDDEPIMRKYCRFAVNSYDGTNDSQVLRSYDIAWGNCVTQFGILGTIILLCLWGYIGLYFYRYRNHPLAFASLILFISFFVGSIAGMSFTQLKDIVIYYALFVLLQKTMAVERRKRIR
ncbi:hypothetical protein Bacsa_0069 [Phocaeicola salanitronis DSM 18170]|uniref:O-antigen polymerase n=1 Tax=Phocaeicola salanitronis (strain DSM 18170 / JCM 13657 / CCUG 60908 / BL78) TaxID=667015 RepID=F0R4J2_PHOSB|nr:hypothetical protein [Phocaeicola salanitronis]ADY34682.1 hypothetical protein Bacsa_0069 [Phocaeicola salanitronis DSM 18170]